MTTLGVASPDGRRARSRHRGVHVDLPDLAMLLDMDGLLVKTELLGQLAERDVIEALGSYVTPAETEELLGCSMARTVKILLARAEEPRPPDEVEAMLDEAMLRLIDQHGVPLMPGARELLDGIRARGFLYALVTSTGREVAKKILARAGLEFQIMVTGDDVTAAKPDPEPYLRAAGLLSVDAARCVALEDSVHGYRAAEAAGCRVIVVPSDGIQVGPAPGRTVVRSLRELRVTPRGVVPAC